MSIYVVGSTKNTFLPLDGYRTKFLVDQKHEGANIDFLNGYMCELTGLYYMWKHCDDDIVGLEHYRRYLCYTGSQPIPEPMSRKLLETYDILCTTVKYPPGKPVKTYLIANGKSDAMMRFITVLGAIYGKDYSDHCLNYINGDAHILGNMFIAKKELADKYCDYLFKAMTMYMTYEAKHHRPLQPRICGYLSEFLLGAWLSYNGKRIYRLGLRMI